MSRRPGCENVEEAVVIVATSPSYIKAQEVSQKSVTSSLLLPVKQNEHHSVEVGKTSHDSATLSFWK